MALVLRPLRPGDAGWVIMRHAQHYAGTYGFHPAFEGVVARVMADLIDTPDPATERGWIAARGPAPPEGCIFCTRLSADTAQLRLFFVEPESRGAGLGRRLLWACIAHAAGRGFSRLVLWTHAEQEAATALYRRAGFAVEEEARRRSFGVEATVLGLALDLSDTAASRSALLQ